MEEGESTFGEYGVKKIGSQLFGMIPVEPELNGIDSYTRDMYLSLKKIMRCIG